MSFSVILPTLNENGHIIKLIEEISQMLGIGEEEGRESANRLVDEAQAAFS